LRTIPENIRYMRKKLGWSQSDLAKELGVNLTTVWRWERGETDIPATRYCQLISMYNLLKW